MAELIDDLIQKIIENRQPKSKTEIPTPIPTANDPVNNANLPTPPSPETHNNITENVVQGVVQDTHVTPLLPPPPPPLLQDNPPTPIIAEIIQGIISQLQNSSNHLDESGEQEEDEEEITETKK